MKTTREPLSDENREKLFVRIKDESVSIHDRADMVRILEWDDALRAALERAEKAEKADDWYRKIGQQLVLTDENHPAVCAFEISEKIGTRLQSERDAALAKLKTAEGALDFYAGQNHMAGLDDWDTVSGEGENWLFPDDESGASPDAIENGGVARQALKAIRSETTSLRSAADGSGSSVGRAPKQGDARHDCETHRDRMPGNATEDGGSSPPQILPPKTALPYAIHYGVKDTLKDYLDRYPEPEHDWRFRAGRIAEELVALQQKMPTRKEPA